MSTNGWLSTKPCTKQTPYPCPGPCPGPKPGPGPCPEPGPKPEICKSKECCCNEDMQKALKLLFDPTIRDAILSDSFAFVGKNFLVGASLELVPPVTGLPAIGNDNTSIPSATINAIDPCKSDFIGITADGFYYPVPFTAGAPVNPYFIPNPVSRVSLCNLDAIIFDYDPLAVEDFTGSLQALLDSKYPCYSAKSDKCCCGNAIYRDIYNPYSFTGNLVNLNAGWLAVYQAEVLGRVGNVLVLANSLVDRFRIYFVCLESIGFYGTDTIIPPPPEVF